MAQTDTQTDGHRDLKTESVQWADSAKIHKDTIKVLGNFFSPEFHQCFMTMKAPKNLTIKNPQLSKGFNN